MARRGVFRKRRILLRQHDGLDFARHGQIFMHELVFGVQLLAAARQLPIQLDLFIGKSGAILLGYPGTTGLRAMAPRPDLEPDVGFAGQFALQPGQRTRQLRAALSAACEETGGDPDLAAKGVLIDGLPRPLDECELADGADVKDVITKGQGKMKPMPAVTGADLDNVVAYVKSLKK